MHQENFQGAQGRKRLAALAFGALGVVYGDIGTSPLYTLKTVFGAHGVDSTPENILGGLSLIFWTLMMVVSVKYVLFVMRADNRGEGGIMALMALAQRSAKDLPRLRWMIAVLAILGASLFYGDGVITPAISVLSAVEGLEVLTPTLEPWVVPVTLLIILGLFWLQKHGTDRIGVLFGPICLLWFIAIAVLGIMGITQHPEVLKALHPYYGISFFMRNHVEAFFALGAVVLCVTGAEALYADMGHFGKKPIEIAWFGLVAPALVLNYFGQGALILSDPSTISDPFYLLVPKPLLLPMIVLACAATVIASQAVISGAFSMTRQAMQLGYVPRMKVVHTSRVISGQIFVPWINRMLLILILLAVVGFQSSGALAAAYGIAVTGTMLITTLLALIVARFQWRWHSFVVMGIGLVLLSMDLAFFSANAIKIEHGGWFPLVLGLVAFAVMTTWRRGRMLVIREIKQGGIALSPFVESIADHPPLRVPGTAVFLTANKESVPHALLHNLKHNKVLHERNVMLTVEMLEIPLADEEERIQVTALGGNFYRIDARFGFTEDPDVPQTLIQSVKRTGLSFDMMDTTFFLARENIIAHKGRGGMVRWRDKLFAFLARNALPATAFFRIPGNRLIELGAQVEI